MNNKKLALAVMAVLLVAGLMGVGIMAWFTSQKSIENNLFQAGTLVIELAEGTPAEALMKFENMQPGDVEEATATIKNAGSLPFKFYAIISEDDSVLGNGGAESEGGYLPDALDVTVTMGGGQVYKGTLTQLLDQVLVFADEYDIPVTIAAGATANIGIKVEFNTAAGNEYQGASFTGTITFIATQVNNPAEWQSFAFEKDKETEVSFDTQGVDMKFTSGENINTVISVEKYVFNPTPPPFATAPVFYLDINSSEPLPPGTSVILMVSYDPAELPAGINEDELRLYHYTGGTWVDITDYVDTANKKIVSVSVSSFSTFMVASPLIWSTAVNQDSNFTYSLRSVALGNNSVYIGYIQSSSGGRDVHRHSPEAPYELINARGTSFEQPKAIAVDDRGYVYTVNREGYGSNRSIIKVYSDDLSDAIATVVLGTYEYGGAAIYRSGSQYYLYVTSEGNGTIYRFNVTNLDNIFIDTSFGSYGSFMVPGGSNLRGITVDSDGTIFVADRDGGRVFRINADLTQTTPVAMTRPMDVALYKGRAYVTSYNGVNSLIRVFDKTDMSVVGDLNIATLDGAPYVREYNAEGLSGIAIGADGRIWVCDQCYRRNGRNYSDRLLVSSPLP